MRAGAATCFLLMAAAGARADLLAHSLVAYGEVPLTTSEQYASPAAYAALSYSSPGVFSGESWSEASYGLVRGTVSVTSTNASYPTNRALAEAVFHDAITISGPTGPGYIKYEYTLVGEAHGEADAHLFLNHLGDPPEELAGEATQSGTYTSELHNIIFGSPFVHGLSIETVAFVGLGESEEASADFYAYLSSIQVFDHDMTLITSFSLSSESGTNYPIAPAPGTFGLVACGGLILGRRRRL